VDFTTRVDTVAHGYAPRRRAVPLALCAPTTSGPTASMVLPISTPVFLSHLLLLCRTTAQGQVDGAGELQDGAVRFGSGSR